MKTTLLVVVVLAILSFGFISPRQGVERKSLIGNTLSDFQLSGIDGSMKSAGSFPDAKGLMLVFTCNHCPFAKLYTQRLNALNERFLPLGIPLIAVNSMDTVEYDEENLQSMRTFASGQGYTFPYLKDGSQELGKLAGADHTPYVCVLWKENGAWVIRYTGAIDDNGAKAEEVKSPYVAQAVSELIAGRPVSTPEARSIGCAISYRK